MRDLDHDPMDVMIVLDQDHLEAEAMDEAIVRTAMMMVGMIKLRSEGIVKRNISGNIILWSVSFSMFVVLLLLHLF